MNAGVHRGVTRRAYDQVMSSRNLRPQKSGSSEKGSEARCSPILETSRSPYEKLLVLDRAISAARNGIVITDPNLPDNPIVYANQSFLQLTGYDRCEVIGFNCRFLQGDDRRQEALSDLRKAVRDERPITVVLRNYNKSGALFWNELTVSPVHDDSGRLINFIGIQNDISARMEADRRIAEFYSMVSHELRTPLTSIRTSLGLLEDGSVGELPADASRLVEIAYRNTDRLVRLVNNILDFRRIEAGKLELSRSVLSVKSVVEQVLGEMRSTADARKVELESSVDGRARVLADRDRLLQILTNLVGNAIKFSAESTAVLVDARVSPYDRKMIRFRIVDQGPGIQREDLPKLFRIFQQIDSSDSRKVGGSGLGLAISKSLVEMHGGTIGVDSRPGEGSVFWFDIPAARPASTRS